MKRKLPDEDPKKAVFVKLSFLTVLLITAVLINYISSTIPTPKIEQKTKSDVLGSQTTFDMKKFITSDPLGIKKRADALRDTLENKAIDIAAEHTDEIQASASSIFFEKVGNPILTQFKSLPQDQQEKVKEAICR